MLRRRAFVSSLTLAFASLLAAPLAAEAQQAGKVYRIGFLSEWGPPAPGVNLPAAG